jgi:hypothetical protein
VKFGAALAPGGIHRAANYALLIPSSVSATEQDRAGYLRSNMASLLKPPLPDADRAKLATLFGHLTGIGLDGHQSASRSTRV